MRSKQISDTYNTELAESIGEISLVEIESINHDTYELVLVCTEYEKNCRMTTSCSFFTFEDFNIP